MLILFRIEKGTLLTQNLILSNLEQEIKALIDKLDSVENRLEEIEERLTELDEKINNLS